jgi:hypothetical protein
MELALRKKYFESTFLDPADIDIMSQFKIEVKDKQIKYADLPTNRPKAILF